jgi:hypothetical protein
MYFTIQGGEYKLTNRCKQDLWSTSPFGPNPSSPTDPHNPSGRHPSSTHPHHPHGHPNNAHHQNSHATANGTNQAHTSSLLPARAPHHRLAEQLLADERAIEQRKLNLRRFGAGWLRPPGVAKTFQARLDEEQERREQAEVARREAQMAELAAAAAQQEQVPVEVLEEERDLDDEVPDADAEVTESEEDDDDDDDDEDEEEEEEEGNVTVEPSRFGEDSMLENSLVGGDGFSPARAERYLDAEDAELDGRAQDMRDLGVERDLDEEIPEAGSYEHTDTEEETSDSDSGSEPCSDDERDSACPPSEGASAIGADLSVLDASVEEMMDSSFVSYTRGSNNTNSARRMRRSMGGVGRSRWSGGSDVVMEGSEAEPSPSVSANSVMARLRAARRHG